jgi:hypothetical protein
MTHATVRDGGREVATFEWGKKKVRLGPIIGRLVHDGAEQLKLRPLTTGERPEETPGDRHLWALLSGPENTRRIEFAWNHVDGSPADAIDIEVRAGAAGNDAELLTLLCCHVLQRWSANTPSDSSLDANISSGISGAF